MGDEAPTYIGVPLPEYEKRTEAPSTETTGGTSTTVLSPRQESVEAQRDLNLADAEATKKKELDLRNKESEIERQKNQGLYEESARQATLDQQASDKANADIAAAKARIEQRQKVLDNTHPSGWFHQGDTWGNALRALGLAMATVGDSAQKSAAAQLGQVSHVNTVGEIIDHDLNLQKEHIAQLKDSVVQAHTGLKDANEAREQMLADRKQAAASAYDRLIKLAAARMAALGKDNNEIANSQEIQTLRDKRNKEMAEVVAPTAKKIESHFTKRGEQVATTERAQQPKVGQTPATLTDTMGGPDFPIDQSRTDLRQHNAAVANLPNINGAIKILDSVQGKTANGEQHEPEWMKYIGVDDAKAQAGLNAQMSRFRSAYAASKKESVGEVNAEHLADAIPDPPSDFSSKTAWQAWQQKIAETRQEMLDMRSEHLALAGVPPAEIAKDRAGTRKAAPAIQPPAPTQPPPFVPAASSPSPADVTKHAPAATPKLRAIKLIKSGDPSIAGAVDALKRKYGITAEDLR
jgi:hypothetical protein